MDKFVSAALFALGLVIAAPASACGTDCASGTWAADLYGRVLNRPGLLDEDRRAHAQSTEQRSNPGVAAQRQ
jgi:hypothetical protein